MLNELKLKFANLIATAKILLTYFNYLRFIVTAIFLSFAIYSYPWFSEIIFPAIYNFNDSPYLATAILCYAALFLIGPAYVFQAGIIFFRKMIKPAGIPAT